MFKFYPRSLPFFILLGLVFWGIGINLKPQTVWAQNVAAIYQQQLPSWNGTGKIYMGREIAPVMGYQAADWLERSTRNQEEASDRLVQLLPLESQDKVADIGAGTGYFSVRLSQRLPQGEVFAVDLQTEMLEIIRHRLEDLEMKNIHPVLGSERSPNLTAQSINLALMVDVYHELAYPQEMLEAIATSLKPNGKLVLAEYKAEDPRILIKPLHKMSQSQIKKEIEAAGFTYQTSLKDLPKQHLLVFQKASCVRSRC